MSSRWRIVSYIPLVVAAGYGLFQFLVSFVLTLEDLPLRAIHLAFAFVLVFISYPATSYFRHQEKYISGLIPFIVGGIGGTLLLMILFEAAGTRLSLAPLPGYAWGVIGLVVAVGVYLPARRMVAHNLMAPMNIVLEVLAITVTLYVIANSRRIGGFMPDATTLDYVISASVIFVMMEAGRRVVGWSFLILVMLLVGYTLFGQYIPGYFGHPRLTPLTVLYSMLMGQGANSYGSLIGISATVVGIVVIWGGILGISGSGQAFINLALLMVGRATGGSAKVAVIASSLVGLISGSAVANVAISGVFTIPMMKRAGCSAAFAAGTEATASTGGQIMPPVMGVGAFIMAEILGISYLKIIIAAALPAVMYYLACFLTIHWEAKKQGLRPIPREEIPTFKTLARNWQTFVSLFVSIAVLVGMMVKGYPISYATAVAFIATAGLYLVLGGKPKPRLVAQRVVNLGKGMVDGSRTLVVLASIVSLSQIVVSLFGLSGLAAKVAFIIASVGGQNLFLALLTGAVACLILGTALPTVAAYLICVGLVVSGLIRLGLPPLVAHMFIFYYACMATITPPVCAAVFVAASMAKCSWPSCCKWALRIGAGGLIVPLIFAYRQGLMFIGTPVDVVVAIIVTTLGIIVWTAGVSGFLSRSLNGVERVALITAGVLLFIPTNGTTIAGGLLAVCLIVWQKFSRSITVRGQTGPGV